jgi:copper chaperone CopZ
MNSRDINVLAPIFFAEGILYNPLFCSRMATIKIKGMHCRSCETLITEALMENGAASAAADWQEGTVTFTGLDEKKAKKAIRGEGYAIG